MPIKSNTVKVLDSFTGSGKTSYILNLINKSPKSTRFLFITPLLDECQRVIDSCPEKNFIQPDRRIGAGSKMKHLINLVLEGRNIVSTHALLQNINDELINALRLSDYVLVLDEAFQVIEPFNLYPEKPNLSEDEREKLTKDDIQWLIKQKYIHIDPKTFLVKWDEDKFVGHKYEQLKEMVIRELIYMVNDTLFLWTFPYEIFAEGIFKDIYVLTYLFEAQYQYYYYKYFDVPFEKYHVVGSFPDYKIVPTQNNHHDLAWRSKAKSLITIIDNEKLNKIGDSYKDIRKRTHYTALSKEWYRENQSLLPILRKNTEYFFRQYASAPEKKLWTTFKDYVKKIKSSRTPVKAFIPISSRATNQYRDRDCVAYLINRYPNVVYLNFFQQKEVKVDSETYAISDLIQWVWRSAIRDGKPITLYIPSERMRRLFIKFLNGEELSLS